MATEIARLVAVLDAQTGEFTAKLREANAQLKETGNAAKKADGDVKGSGGGMSSLAKGAGIAGLALGGVLVGGLISSVKGAMAAQAANAALDQAIKNTGQSAAAAAPQIDSAQAAARNLGFANSDTTASLTRLEQVTGSTGKSISDLSIAENVARAKHEDLGTATASVTGALMGNARAAKQLGVMISPVTTNIDALTAANGGSLKGVDALTIAHAKLADKLATGAATVSAISAKVKDQASIYAGTAAGGMAKFSAQMDYIKETIGTALLPALGDITQAVGKFTGYLAANPAVMKLLLVGLGALAIILVTASVATKLITAAQTIGSIASKGFAAAQWLVNAAMDANPIMLVVIALVAIGVAFYEAWTRSATFRDIVKGAFKDVTKAASDFAEFFTTDIPDAFKTVIGWLRANWPIVMAIIIAPFAPLVALALGAFYIRSALVTAFQGILSDIAGVMGTIISAITTPFTSVGSTLAGVGTDILNGIVGGLGNIGTAIWTWISTGVTYVGSVIVAGVTQIGTWIWDGVTSFASAALDIWGWIYSAITTVAGNVGSFFSDIGHDITVGVGSFGATALDIWGWIYSAVTRVASSIGSNFSQFGDDITHDVGSFGGTALNIWGWIYSAVTHVASSIGSNFTSIGGDISRGVGSFGAAALNIWGWVSNAFSGVATKAYNDAKTVGGHILSGVKAGIGVLSGLGVDVWDAVKTWWNDNVKGKGSFHVLGVGWNGLPGLAGGGVVPGSGTGDTVHAMLTPGEIVLNAAQQKNVAQAVTSGGMPSGVAAGSGRNTHNTYITIAPNFGVVGNPAQAAQMIADMLVGHGRRHPGALGGLA